MKTRIGIFLAIFAGGLLFAANSTLQTTTPEDRVVPEIVVLAEKAMLGKVTFNHGSHITKNPDANCVTCHHVEQPAAEAAKVPGHKTAYPADRTVTLTAETYKDGTAPAVTACVSCHLQKNAKPSILTEVPKMENTVLNNQNAFHRSCADCHDKATKANAAVQAPTATKCVGCHKKA